MARSVRLLAAAGALLGLLGCGSSAPPTGPTPSTQPSGTTAVLAGAGDIAVCGVPGAAATASLLDGISGTVFTAGDNVYDNGTADEFLRCYDPTWGRHRSRTRAAPGNHDYGSPGAGPYFTYFGTAAGTPGLGYYSFDAGAWHVVSLNSNIAADEGSPQYAWLGADLSRHSTRCLAAIWHHPLYSSSQNGPQPMMRAVWTLLQQFGAEFVVSGHDHVYERFGPQDASGHSVANGIRQFVVGTGGAPLYSFGATQPASEARSAGWGVIKFTLYDGSYFWEFIPAAGSSFSDSGSDVCH